MKRQDVPASIKATQNRLKSALHDFVQSQRHDRKANDATALHVRAAARLGAGWSDSTIRSYLGLKTREGLAQLPHLKALLRFCDVAGISADWLFAGLGPRSRRTMSAGGTLSAAELARELEAHMIAACAPLYARDQALTCDAAALLETLTGFVVAQATADEAEAEAWALDQEAYTQLVSAANAVIDTYEAGDTRPVNQVVSALYFATRRMEQSDLRPTRRVPIAPAD